MALAEAERGRAGLLRAALASLIEQGTGSGTNLLLNVLLARWLAPAEYGAFAVALAVHYAVGGLYLALVVEPMGVIAPRRYRERLPEYLGALLRAHVVASALAALGFTALAGGLAVVGSRVAPSALALAAAAPLMLLQWLFRHACYALSKPRVALAGAVAYAVALLAPVAGLRVAGAHGAITAAGALGLMAVASGAASAVMAAVLGVRVREGARFAVEEGLAAQHWRFGRWIAAATTVHGVGTGMLTPLVGGILGLEASGALRVLQNLFLPLQQAVSAIGMLALPIVARRAAEGGVAAARSATLRLLAVELAVSGAYAACAALFGQAALRLVYQRADYVAYGAMLPLLGVSMTVAAASQAFAISLRATERPDAILWSKVATLAAVAVAVPLVPRLGLRGALAGLVAGGLAEAAVLWFQGLRGGARRTPR